MAGDDMTADEIIYYALVAMIPLAITCAIVWAMWGKFDDELFKRDE